MKLRLRFLFSLALILFIGLGVSLTALPTPTSAQATAPALVISPSANPVTFVEQGNNNQFTVHIQNTGNAPSSVSAAPATVTAFLPTGITYKGAVPGTSGFDCSGTAVGAGTVNCVYTGAPGGGVLPAGYDNQLTIQVNVSKQALLSGGFNVSITPDPAESNQLNNTYAQNYTVTPKPDLEVTRLVHIGDPLPGSGAFGSDFLVNRAGTILATVANTGNGSSSGPITLTFDLPTEPGFVYNGVSATGGKTFTCDNTNPLSIVCTSNSTFDPGNIIDVSITVTPANPTTAARTATATVGGGGEPTPYIDAKNSKQDTNIVVHGIPTLTLTKTHTDPFIAGSQQQYTFTVTNAGSGPTTGPLTLTDTLPAGMTFVSGSSDSGRFDCSTSSGSNVTCISNSIFPASGGGDNNEIITVVVAVPAGASGLVTNTASVTTSGSPSSSQNTNVPDPTNIKTVDVQITKTHTGEFTVGALGNKYTITLKNLGNAITNPTAAGSITVTDTLPTGMTLSTQPGQTSGSAQFTCTGNAATPQLVTCASNVGVSLAAAGTAGDTATFDIFVDVAKGAYPTQTNSAQVAAPGDPATNPNNQVTDAATTIRRADLQIKKTPNPAVFTAGSPGTYTITVTNVGDGVYPKSAAGTVTVVETLPSGGFLGTVSISGTGWSCSSAATNPITCTYDLTVLPGDLAVNASLPPITVTVNPPSTASGLTNQVTVAENKNIDGNTANDTDTVPTSVNAAPVPDIEVVKSTSGTFAPGGTAQYVFNVRNNGTVPAAVGSLTLQDTLPVGVTFASETDTGNKWAACTPNGQTITCINDQAFPPDATFYTLSFTVNIASGISGSLQNTVTVQSAPGDANPANNSSSITTPLVVSGVDLTISKTHPRNFIPAAPDNDYQIVVHNIGSTATSSSITVTDNLPAGFTYRTGTSGTGWSCSANVALTVVTCTYSVAINGNADSNPLTIGVNVPLSPPQPTLPYSEDNNAFVSYGATELQTNNNSTVDTTVVSAGNVPDLTVTKTHTDPLTVNANGTYTITVSNVGTGAATGPFTITDTLPAGFQFISNSTNNGWQVCTTSGTTTVTVTCQNSTISLPAYSSATPTANQLGALTLTVKPTQVAASPGVTNVVKVTAIAGEGSTTNNTAQDPTIVVGAADLQITKTATSNFRYGQAGSYQIVVQNIGTSAAGGTTTVSDTLPNGLTFVVGSGGGQFGCNAVGQVVTCTRAASIAANESATITINVTVGTPAQVANPVQNTATVASSDPNVGDAYNGANSSTVSTPVTLGSAFDVTVSKTHTGNFVIGQQGTYTITVSNPGDIPTAGTITVHDTLNPLYTFFSGSGGVFTCSAVGQNVTCTNTGGNIPAGGNMAIQLVVNVSSTATANTNVTNQATVDPVPGEASTANNSSQTDTVTLTTVPPVSGTNSTICVSPTSLLANNSDTTTVTVTVRDTQGTLQSGKTVTLNTSTNPSSMSSSLTTTGPTAGSAGVYTFAVKSSAAGTATFSATVDGITIATCSGGSRSVTFTSTTGMSVGSSTLTANPTTLAINNTSTATVTILDNSGQPVSGAGVTLTYTTNTGNNNGITIGGASTNTATATTVNGVATFQIASSQNQTLTLSATATKNGETITLSQHPTITFGTGGTSNGGIGSTQVTIDCQSIPADNLTTANVTVTVVSSNNGGVSGKTFTLTANPVITGMTISPASVVTDASGNAKFTIRSTAVGGPVTLTATNTTDAQTVAQTVQLTFTKAGTKCVPAPNATATGTATGGAVTGPAYGMVITRLLCIRTGPGFAYSRYQKALPYRTIVLVLGRTTRVPGLGPRDNCIKKGGPTWYFVQLNNGVTVWANANFIRLDNRLAFRALPVLPQPVAPGFPGSAPSGLPIGPAEPGVAPVAPKPTGVATSTSAATATPTPHP